MLDKVIAGIMGMIVVGFVGWVMLRPRSFIACECQDCGFTWRSWVYLWGTYPPADRCPMCGSANIIQGVPLTLPSV